MEERKFVCKYCSKRFPCGKSLGGHIRTHTTEERNNAENNINNNSDDDDHHHLKLLDSGRKRKRERDSSSWPESASAGGSSNNNNNNHPIYGLRENPKKTTRFVHIDATLSHEDERFCKECGKGFPSLKALCGHMACHSEKDKDQKLVMDTQSDTESCGAPSHPRRSKRMKFKTLNITNNQPSPPPYAPLANASSSVSEVEQEQEEVARMLIMLSRDSTHKGRFASVAESSDNNSIVLETAKSSSPETKVAANKGNNGKSSNFVSSNAYGVLQKKQVKDINKVKYADNSDFGQVGYGLKIKRVESDVPNYDVFKSKDWNVRDKSGFGDYNVESRKVLSKGRNKYIEAAALKDLDDIKDGTSRKFELMKRGSNYESLGGHSSANVSSKKTSNGFANDEIYENNGRKSCKYESLASEYDGSYDSTEEESDENSTDTESFSAPKSRNNKANNGKKSSKAKKKLKSKKSREHECPICYRIFRSGQALGGHKRSHFIGGSEENTTLVIKQGAPPAVPCLIDLNLPAPADE